MPSERAPDSLVSAWQQQSTSGFRMVPADFARKMRADVRWSRRGFAAYLLLFVVLFIVAGVSFVSETDWIVRVGHLLQVVTVVFFAGQMVILRERVRAVRFDVGRTTAPSLTAARAYLITRGAFHRGRWLWSRVLVLLPVVPILSYGQLRAGSLTTQGYVTGVLLPWMALLVFAVFIVQRGAARSYERLLRELDDIERQSPADRFMAAHEAWADGQQKER
jgi:hypothetical protein